jgi:hypothetical protein
MGHGHMSCVQVMVMRSYSHGHGQYRGHVSCVSNSIVVALSAGRTAS